MYHILLFFCRRHKNDKLFLTDFVNTLRRSLSNAILQTDEQSIDDLKNPRLPAIDALYLAKALMVSTAPFDPLYKPVNNFFIAKQFVNLTVVPDFLSLFHDSDVESAERRLWVLDIIRDGTKTMTDVNVVFKTMCLKMIMDFNSSVLSDRKTHVKILEVMSSIVAIPRAFGVLVEGYGLVSWLHSFVRQMGREDKSSVKRVFNLIQNMLHSLRIDSFARNVNSCANNGKAIESTELKVNKDIEHEIMVILYDVLKLVDEHETEHLALYMKTCTMVSKRTIKLLTKKQILSLISKSAKDSECSKLLAKAIVKNDVTILRSKNVQSDDELLQYLTVVVKAYLG